MSHCKMNWTMLRLKQNERQHLSYAYMSWISHDQYFLCPLFCDWTISVLFMFQQAALLLHKQVCRHTQTDLKLKQIYKSG